MTVDATLASIDGALQDWGTSGDAMRWNPDAGRVICDGGGPMMPDPYGWLRHGDYRYRVAPMVLDPSAMPRLDFLREAATSFALFGEAYVAAAAPVLSAFGQSMAQAVNRAFGHSLAVDICKAFAVPLWTSDHTHARPGRCRTCNPAGNPRPLAIDGAAYRRRQRNRRTR